MTFRSYRGPFTIDTDISDSAGNRLVTNLVGTISALPMNDIGVIAGTAAVSASFTAVATTPGRAPRTVTEMLNDTKLLTGTVYDFMVQAGSFAAAQASASYSFTTSGNNIVLEFKAHEILTDVAVAPGVTLSGGRDFSATLTAPSGEARIVNSQFFQSLLAENEFKGWSGIDTVEYTYSGSHIAADLETGTGVNALGGTDRYTSIENLTGSAFNDTLAGDAQNNVLSGGMGDDMLIGRAGRDTAAYASSRAVYDVANAGTTATVTGVEGVDTLEGIERLRFSGGGVALDLGAAESAGMTVRVIGAAFDTPHLTADLIGIGISVFDGGMSMLQVCQLAVDTQLFASLAGSRSNVDFVNTVYRNVVGVLPTAADRDFFVGLLQGSGGTMSQAELLVLAANAVQNEGNINLVGLQQTGVEFI
jgi:hypothetical protein